MNSLSSKALLFDQLSVLKQADSVILSIPFTAVTC